MHFLAFKNSPRCNYASPDGTGGHILLVSGSQVQQTIGQNGHQREIAFILAGSHQVDPILKKGLVRPLELLLINFPTLSKSINTVFFHLALFRNYKDTLASNLRFNICLNELMTDLYHISE